MRSLTSFLRRRGYALREIHDLLKQLETHRGFDSADFLKGGPLEEVLEQLKKEPAAAKLSRSRLTLKEHGITPTTQQGHTLVVPVSAKPGVPCSYLYFTRVAEDKWVYFVDTQNGDSHITVHT
jgi:hypothetical protein